MPPTTSAINPKQCHQTVTQRTWRRASRSAAQAPSVAGSASRASRNSSSAFLSSPAASLRLPRIYLSSGIEEGRAYFLHGDWHVLDHRRFQRCGAEKEHTQCSLSIFMFGETFRFGSLANAIVAIYWLHGEIRNLAGVFNQLSLLSRGVGWLRKMQQVERSSFLRCAKMVFELADGTSPYGSTSTT